ncbi:MAG: carboxypeptidase regulatory-like domain-containing protein [Candidatus Latescibacteria bacterium]|nr:carboxypeptidase regulatory-like domain-containing protein [Candidatus Latescibacterota bacterium]
MKCFYIIMLVVILSVVSGCIFSMNDDYRKTFTRDGEQGSGEYTVSGVIIDSSGKGVSGVKIELVGTLTVSTVTDANGEYVFEKVASGSYVVRPPSSKYAPMPITVTDGDHFVGKVKNNGHGGNKNGDYSCSQCH